MSGTRLGGRVTLILVLIGIVMLSVLGTVGSLAHDRQHHTPQSLRDANLPREQAPFTTTKVTSNTSKIAWNMGRANSANTNHINTTGPTSPITKRWGFVTKFNTIRGPVVANGTVYFGTKHYEGAPGKVYAVDAWTGSEKWKFTPKQDVAAAPAIFRDTLYVPTYNGRVYALNAETGEVYWIFNTAGAPRDLIVANRTLYITTGGGHVYALGALRGEEKWAFTTDGQASTPAVKDGTVYVSARYGNVTALDAETGNVDWNVNIINKNDTQWLNQPSVANGLVYVSNKVFHNSRSDSHLFALDAETGEVRWKRTKPRAGGFSTPAVLGNTAYFTGKYLHAVNAMTGTDRWSIRDRRSIPRLANDIAYNRGGRKVYALDPATGEERGRFTIDDPNATTGGSVVLNGSLYSIVRFPGAGPAKYETAGIYALGTPEFNYSNFSVTPSSAEIGESVKATITIANTGTGPGTYNATLAVNGAPVNNKASKLNAGTRTAVTFELRFPKNGTYTVKVGGLTRTVTVGDSATNLTQNPTLTPVPDTETPQTGTSDTFTTGTSTTPTAGTSPGFGGGVWVVAVAVVIMLLRNRDQD